MRELLFSSALALLMVACGTSEDSVTDGPTAADSVVVDGVITDTSKAITHGSPDQQELDSLKNSKLDKKKK